MSTDAPTANPTAAGSPTAGVNSIYLFKQKRRFFQKAVSS
jgi:hypothetical protein